MKCRVGGARGFVWYVGCSVVGIPLRSSPMSKIVEEVERDERAWTLSVSVRCCVQRRRWLDRRQPLTSNINLRRPRSTAQSSTRTFWSRSRTTVSFGAVSVGSSLGTAVNLGEHRPRYGHHHRDPGGCSAGPVSHPAFRPHPALRAQPAFRPQPTRRSQSTRRLRGDRGSATSRRTRSFLRCVQARARRFESRSCRR